MWLSRVLLAAEVAIWVQIFSEWSTSELRTLANVLGISERLPCNVGGYDILKWTSAFSSLEA